MIPHLCVSTVTAQCCAKVLRVTVYVQTAQINISLPEGVVDLAIVITSGSFHVVNR